MASSSRSSSSQTPEDPADDVKTRQAGSAEWRPKHYVLAGMAIILAASTVTIVTSVVLRPAPIKFSVANFTMSSSDNAQYPFYFNISACNPSRRAGVIYRHVVVSMQLQKHGGRSVRKTSVPGIVTATLPLSQERSKNVSMRVNGIIYNKFFDYYSGNPSTTIMVIAEVQFRVGLVKSRLYSIRVLCKSIDNIHPNMSFASANCSA